MSDDDYMSEDFLAQLQDVKPSIAANRAQQRMLRIHANRDAAENHQRSVPKKHEIEKQKLEEGLSKPLDSQSKGFSLLAKMGYKPGMSIGKKKEGDEGIKEPIPIQMKTGRMGLGGETHEKEKQKERCEMHLQRMHMQAKMNEVLADDFRQRKRGRTVQKQVIGDILKTRKACQELDVRQGRELPEEYWFWPIYAAKASEEPTSTTRSDPKRLRLVKSESDEDDERKYHYSNGKEAPPEIQFEDFDEDELIERLETITTYVRRTHFYCIWCGCAYESADELSDHCPGSTRQDHEE
ncbi:G-patch domain containing protein [Aphelenchoides avenae]|nr:G-patch domain containing protein [Aphelenchus avenae]